MPYSPRGYYVLARFTRALQHQVEFDVTRPDGQQMHHSDPIALSLASPPACNKLKRLSSKCTCLSCTTPTHSSTLHNAYWYAKPSAILLYDTIDTTVAAALTLKTAIFGRNVKRPVDWYDAHLKRRRVGYGVKPGSVKPPRALLT